MNNGERPRGNRPAEHAKQATPGSLDFQKSWQGDALAGDFLGLNDPNAPTPEPVAPRARNTAGPATPTSAANAGSGGMPRPAANPALDGGPGASAGFGAGDSWLLSDEDPAATMGNSASPVVGARANPPAASVAPRADAVLDAEGDCEPEVAPETAEESDAAESAPNARAASYRGPNLLEASWTEPAAPRRASRRPLLVGVCVAGVLAVGGYVAFGPKPPVSTGDDLALAPASPAPVTSKATSRAGDASNSAPSSEAARAMPEPTADGTPDATADAPTGLTAAPTDAEETPENAPAASGPVGEVELEILPDEVAAEPLVAPDATSGRMSVDIHGQVQAVPPAADEVAVPAVPPAPASIAEALQPDQREPAVVAQSVPEAAPAASSAATPPKPAPAVSEPARAGEETAAAKPSPSQVDAPREIARPRFQAPDKSTSKPGTTKDAPALPPVSSPDAHAAAPELALATPAAGQAKPEPKLPLPTVEAPTAPAKSTAGLDRPLPEGPSAAPAAAGTAAPATPLVTPPAPVSAKDAGAPEAAAPVKVLGTESTSLADAAKARPAVDEHASAVPSVPPVPPAAPAPEGAPDVAVGPAPVPAPAHETREVALPPKDVLLPSIPVEGVRAAQGKDLDGVWSGDAIPLDRIGNKTKLLTPSVGDVRVTLKSKDVFEGRLYAVGQDSVWIEGAFGRLGLTQDRIASVEKLAPPAPAAGGTSSSGSVQKFSRVRVKTAGGPVLGTVLAIDGDKLKVVTDSGLKLMADAKDVELYVEEPKIVIKQPAKQG